MLPNLLAFETVRVQVSDVDVWKYWVPFLETSILPVESVLLLKNVSPFTPMWQVPNVPHIGLTSGQTYYTGGVGTTNGQVVLYVV